MRIDERFQDGERIYALYWPNDAGMLTAVDKGVESIEVVMENGQMSPVPWAMVRYTDGMTRKYNLALVEGVEFYRKGEA